MSNTARLMIDPSTLSTAGAIHAAAEAAPCLVLGQRALVGLAAELGGMDAASRYLLDVAEDLNKPIGANLERGDGSQTVFIGPRSWSEEQLAGWIGGHHAELEDAFGAVARAGTDGQPPAGRG